FEQHLIRLYSKRFLHSVSIRTSQYSQDQLFSFIHYLIHSEMFNPRPQYFICNEWRSYQQSFFLPFMIAFYFFLLAVALILNATILVVLFRLRKKLFEPPVSIHAESLIQPVNHATVEDISSQGSFFTVVVGLVIFTFLNAIVQAIFFAPQYSIEAFDCSPSFQRASIMLDMISNYGILGFSTLVGANRLSTFSFASKCPVFSVRWRLRSLLLLVCLVVLTLAATPAALDCSMVHAATAAGYVEVCPNEDLARGVKVSEEEFQVSIQFQ
ncbi:hypothetical protein PMAYCL1PPCAC_19089, partial [Pristionchus mayeri]